MEFSDLDTINQNLRIFFVVEADQAFYTSAFVCRIRVIPDSVLVLLAFDIDRKIPGDFCQPRMTYGGGRLADHASPL